MPTLSKVLKGMASIVQQNILRKVPDISTLTLHLLLTAHQSLSYTNKDLKSAMTIEVVHLTLIKVLFYVQGDQDKEVD